MAGSGLRRERGRGSPALWIERRGTGFHSPAVF
jgi:hypothetical protein